MSEVERICENFEYVFGVKPKITKVGNILTVSIFDENEKGCKIDTIMRQAGKEDEYTTESLKSCIRFFKKKMFA